jgi:hypothetical protein
MAQLRVDCINKTDRRSAHERIHALGGPHPNGGRWKESQAGVIRAIENGTDSFYVERPPSHRVMLVVAISQWGNNYVKTETDGEQPDNLLSLPECS